MIQFMYLSSSPKFFSVSIPSDKELSVYSKKNNPAVFLTQNFNPFLQSHFQGSLISA